MYHCFLPQSAPVPDLFLTPGFPSLDAVHRYSPLTLASAPVCMIFITLFPGHQITVQLQFHLDRPLEINTAGLVCISVWVCVRVYPSITCCSAINKYPAIFGSPADFSENMNHSDRCCVAVSVSRTVQHHQCRRNGCCSCGTGVTSHAHQQEILAAS